MNFENRWVLRSALNFASDGEIVREVGREFQRKGPEKAKADLAKECLTRVKKKREEEDDRKPGRLENSLSKLEGSRSREQVVDDIELIILVSSKRFIGVNTEKDSVVFQVHLSRLKLPEEFIVDDQNGCDVTLRSFIRWQRMHALLGLKLPKEFIVEDVRLPSGRKWFTIRTAIVYYPHVNGFLSGALAVSEPLCKEEE
ncbi:hypothetical protein HELRODRAFT_158934 [Helobdella robusta]|uniref:Uncharacterized protein n=1 Tax=Helobdella robusta TaxID=6412 RepID=T1ENF3_HELRO|nr:hypothetical protein HELRODRAFT_158934 [Helobdella robusta]ESO12410.1 hypothetical protein HELRODRAFT_158934 [Helobdella robusta]